MTSTAATRQRALLAHDGWCHARGRSHCDALQWAVANARRRRGVSALFGGGVGGPRPESAFAPLDKTRPVGSLADRARGAHTGHETRTDRGHRGAAVPLRFGGRRAACRASPTATARAVDGHTDAGARNRRRRLRRRLHCRLIEAPRALLPLRPACTFRAHLPRRARSRWSAAGQSVLHTGAGVL